VGVDAAGPHWERTSALSVTADGTALVAVTLEVSADIGIEPAIDLGRIHAAMEEDVPSNLPDDGVVAALAP
jgi:hypothetical protein